MNELHEELWAVFQEWWPAFVPNLDRVEKRDENSIEVHFVRNGHITDGYVYVFGKNVDGSYWLHFERE